MKSMATDSKRRVHVSDMIGKRGGLGLVGLFFHDWQSEHPLMYLVIMSFIPGHQ